MNYENTLFLNMFPDYQPPEEIQQMLAQAAIVAADIDPASRTVEVCVFAPNYIPQRILNHVGTDIAAIYGLRKFNIRSTHPTDQLFSIETEELLQMFMEEDSMNRGSLAGARWEWKDQTLHIHLKANGKALLEECLAAVKEKLRQKFSADGRRYCVGTLVCEQ